MKTPKALLERNRLWASKIKANDPDFFANLSKLQAPEYLWIGCSDSRVPANQIIDMQPGEVFVHRNIANVVIQDDLNCLSVIQFAVEVLKVKHIIVCGHYGCGGIRAALSNHKLGLIDNWLVHIKNIIRKHEKELENLNNKQKEDRLCELNVIEQVITVCNTTIVQGAWENGANLSVNGWIYSIQDGIINDLGMSINSKEELKNYP